MPFDLNTFVTQGLIYGGARTSKFDVQATLPAIPIASAIDPTSIQKLQFTCYAASIPSFQVGEVLIPYFGRKIKSAGDRVWNDWRISIQLDEDYNTRAMFEAWNNSINRLEANIMQPSMDGSEGYKSDWTITHYGKDGTSIRAYTLQGAWPRVLGPITLDWNGTDRISEYEVEVPFDNLIPSLEGAKGNGTSYADAVDSTS
jgi:hypothetical protein